MAMEEGEKVAVRLDGSHGLGYNANLTIITAGPLGERETTYEIPYVLLNKTALDGLQDAVTTGWILGYAVKKILPPDSKTVVLTDRGNLRTEGEDI